MPPQRPETSPERQQTDMSLKSERQKTDQEFGKRETALKKSSDAGLQQVRGRADEALDEAREQANEKLEREGSSGEQLQALGQERAQGDAALQEERLAADEKLLQERQERMRMLANLFRYEREQTDERLRIERGRADATLAARDDFMGMVFMQLPTPICMTRGREHVFELANPSFLRLVGKRELAGKSVRTAFPDLEGQPFFELMDRAFTSGETFHGSETPVRLDWGEGAPKEERFFTFVYQPLLGFDGKVDGIVTFAFEVTEQVRARQKTQAAELRARFLGEASTVLGASLDATVTLDNLARLTLPMLADFCIVDVADDDRKITRVATAHVDAAKEELLRELQLRYPPTWDSSQPVARVFRTGQPELLSETPPEVIAAHTQGTEHATLMLRLGVRSFMAVPMLVRGRTIGVLSLGFTEPGRRYTAQDLPLAQELAERASHAIDNARLYSEAQQAIRIRDEFLAVASHELKTPLTPIQLHLQSLTKETLEEQRGTLDPWKVRRKLDMIGRQVRRLESLVHGLLEVSRFTGQKLKLEARGGRPLGAHLRGDGTIQDRSAADEYTAEGGGASRAGGEVGQAPDRTNHYESGQQRPEVRPRQGGGGLRHQRRRVRPHTGCGLWDRPLPRGPGAHFSEVRARGARPPFRRLWARALGCASDCGSPGRHHLRGERARERFHLHRRTSASPFVTRACGGGPTRAPAAGEPRRTAPPRTETHLRGHPPARWRAS